MRAIEPMGYLTSVPPAHPTALPGSLLRQRPSGSFYELLQAASAAYRKPAGPVRVARRPSDKRGIGQVGFSR
ncbi:MAG: hypothetical protein HQL90_12490 [Magnetococcales bacterium]|nr:hypothetical protein [Magnetococcales bacterium]